MKLAPHKRFSASARPSSVFLGEEDAVRMPTALRDALLKGGHVFPEHPLHPDEKKGMHYTRIIRRAVPCCVYTPLHIYICLHIYINIMAAYYVYVRNTHIPYTCVCIFVRFCTYMSMSSYIYAYIVCTYTFYICLHTSMDN